MKRRSIYLELLTRKILHSMMISLVFFSGAGCSRDQGSGYSVMKGPFRQSVIETGELQAVNASFLGMPRINYIYGYNFKIIGLAEHGKNVHKGDTVIKVDPSSVQKFIIERSESLENEIASTKLLNALCASKFLFKAKLYLARENLALSVLALVDK